MLHDKGTTFTPGGMGEIRGNIKNNYVVIKSAIKDEFRVAFDAKPKGEGMLKRCCTIPRGPEGVLKFGFGRDVPLRNLKVDPYKY